MRILLKVIGWLLIVIVIANTPRLIRQGIVLFHMKLPRGVELVDLHSFQMWFASIAWEILFLAIGLTLIRRKRPKLDDAQTNAATDAATTLTRPTPPGDDQASGGRRPTISSSKI
jgi:hypothetical protein